MNECKLLLGGLLVELPEVFHVEVLKKWLDPTDCALLARACWKCAKAVAASSGGGVTVIAGDTRAVPLKLVAFFGSVELLAWAKDNGCPWSARVCALAAEGGHLAVLQWAREHACPWSA